MRSRRFAAFAAAVLLSLWAADTGRNCCIPEAQAAQTVTYEQLDPSFNGGEPIRGVDISTIISLEKSGVKFCDENGREQDIFRTLADSGVNYIRVRVWNEPYDSSGNGYGGGNSDVYTAGLIGKRAADCGMKLLVDIHYSDFWADPSKQTRPKYWAQHDHNTLKSEIYKWTSWVLESVTEAGGDIGMVQVGNETQCFFCGEKDMYKICDLFSSGEKAVRDFNRDILICHHFTNPDSGNCEWYAKVMNECGLDYDVFATSYYPYWHGSLGDLGKMLKTVGDTYNKYVMVAETAYPYTNEDGDAFPDSVTENTSNAVLDYPISVEGQAQCITDVFRTVAETGSHGIGVFYWEPAWLGLQGASYDKQKENWNRYGSGWASDAAAEYDKDVTGAGGSGFDNQALFDFSGKPLESLKVFMNIYPRREKMPQINYSEVAEGTYRIRNVRTGRYLTVEGGEASDGAGVVQYTADGAADYNSWYVEPDGRGAYSIRSAAGDKGLVLDFADNGIVLSSPGGASSQSFRFSESGEGMMILSGTDSSGALGVGEDDDGAAAEKHSRSGSAEQEWVLEPVERFRITGDLNGDGCVNAFDLVYLRGRLAAESGGEDGDLNSDGAVNIADLTTMERFLLGRGGFREPTHGTPANTVFPVKRR